MGRVRQTPGWPHWGRLETPEDIAAVVAMLVGPDAEWVTGQNVRTHGGPI